MELACLLLSSVGTVCSDTLLQDYGEDGVEVEFVPFFFIAHFLYPG
jgi:hypothetical protein